MHRDEAHSAGEADDGGGERRTRMAKQRQAESEQRAEHAGDPHHAELARLGAVLPHYMVGRVEHEDEGEQEVEADEQTHRISTLRAMGGVQGEAHATIAAPPAACVAALTDFAAYPEWYPFVEEIAVGERDPQDGTTVVEALTRLPVKTIRYTLRYHVEGDSRVWADYLRGDFKALSLDWRLAPGPGGATITEATLALRGEVGWVLDRLLAPVRDAARRELIDDAVAALKRRVESAPRAA